MNIGIYMNDKFIKIALPSDLIMEEWEISLLEEIVNSCDLKETLDKAFNTLGIDPYSFEKETKDNKYVLLSCESNF